MRARRIAHKFQATHEPPPNPGRESPSLPTIPALPTLPSEWFWERATMYRRRFPRTQKDSDGAASRTPPPEPGGSSPSVACTGHLQATIPKELPRPVTQGHRDQRHVCDIHGGGPRVRRGQKQKELGEQPTTGRKDDGAPSEGHPTTRSRSAGKKHRTTHRKARTVSPAWGTHEKMLQSPASVHPIPYHPPLS